jgi:hypothetical protein
MLRKVFTASFVVAAMAIVPMFARADFQAGNWELELGGSGTANKQVSAGNFAIAADLGYFLTKNIEVAVRQSVGFADAQHSKSIVTASTAIAADWNFDMGNFVPFVGGNVGYAYGNNGFKDQWAAGPEAGLKWFLNSTTFVYGIVEYEILFGGNHVNSSNNGLFMYQVGLGVALK